MPLRPFLRRCLDRLGYRWFCLATFCLLTTGILFPALRTASVTLPVPMRTGGPPTNTVPLFNSWTIWWNADRLTHGLSDYWNAPIFYPEQGTFAFSEPQPATMLLAPIVWSSDTPYLAYHCYLFLNLLLNALFSVWFLRCLRVSRPAAVMGGVAVLWLPLIWEQLDTIQLLPIWPALWIWSSIICLTETRLESATLQTLNVRRRHVIPWKGVASLAMACVVLASLCIHHLLMLAWVSLPASLYLIVDRRLQVVAVRFTRLALSGLLAAMLLLPIVLPMLQIHASQEFQRSEQTQQALSVTAGQWIAAPNRAWWNADRNAQAIGESSFNPGALRLALAGLLLLIMPNISHQRRRSIVFLGIALLTAVGLSLGTNLQLGSIDLWSWLNERIPFLSSVRSIYRFAYFAQLAMIMLAAISLDQCWRRCRSWLWRYRRRQRQERGRSMLQRLAKLGWSAIFVVMAIEVPLPRLRLMSGPLPAPNRAWLDQLATPSAIRQPILCLPMSAGLSEQALQSEARWMLFSTWHGRPMLNGYSGFFPTSWFENTARFSKAELTAEDLDYLEQQGVTTLVLDRQRANCPTIPLDLTAESRSPRLQQMSEVTTGVAIYRIQP